MNTKFGIDVKRDGGLQATAPLQLCKTCGTNIEFYQCWCKQEVKEPASVANTPSTCELGEHCRCTKVDGADCWNLIGKVTL